MERMFIFIMHPDVWNSFKKKEVYFAENEKEILSLISMKDQYLALDRFDREIPVAIRVELYVKSNTDWLFEMCWTVKKTREDAWKETHGRSSAC